MEWVPVPWLDHMMESRPHGYILVDVSQGIKEWLYPRVERYRVVLGMTDEVDDDGKAWERLFIELDHATAFEFAMRWR